MALGPNSLVFLQRTTLGRLNPLVRSERPPDTRRGRQSTIIPALSRETTPGGLDTLLKTRYTVQFHAEFVLSSVVAVPRMRILPRVSVIADDRSPHDLCNDFSSRTNTMSRVRRMRPQALSCFDDASTVAVVLELHRRSSRAVRDVFGRSGKASPRSQSLYWAPC